MNNRISLASSCRHCRFYGIEGRRGGYCQQLDVQVQGSWKACSLAVSPFKPAWEELEEVMILSPQSEQIPAGVS